MLKKLKRYIKRKLASIDNKHYRFKYIHLWKKDHQMCTKYYTETFRDVAVDLDKILQKSYKDTKPKVNFTFYYGSFPRKRDDAFKFTGFLRWLGFDFTIYEPPYSEDIIILTIDVDKDLLDRLLEDEIE